MTPRSDDVQDVFLQLVLMGTFRSFSHIMLYSCEHPETEIQNRGKTLRAASKLVRLHTGAIPAEFTVRGKNIVKHYQTRQGTGTGSERPGGKVY